MTKPAFHKSVHAFILQVLWKISFLYQNATLSMYTRDFEELAAVCVVLSNWVNWTLDYHLKLMVVTWLQDEWMNAMQCIDDCTENEWSSHFLVKNNKAGAGGAGAY